jgi:hypothetical protein
VCSDRQGGAWDSCVATSDLGPSIVTGLAVVAGGFLAVAGGVATQLIQTRGSSQARADVRRDQRDGLQRQTLLDLQEAVYRYSRAVLRGFNQDLEAFKVSGKWAAALLGSELDDELRDSLVRLRLLMERVRDDELRALINELADEGAMVGIQPTREAASKSNDLAFEKFKGVMDRSGVVLRPLL